MPLEAAEQLLARLSENTGKSVQKLATPSFSWWHSCINTAKSEQQAPPKRTPSRGILLVSRWIYYSLKSSHEIWIPLIGRALLARALPPSSFALLCRSFKSYDLYCLHCFELARAERKKKLVFHIFQDFFNNTRKDVASNEANERTNERATPSLVRESSLWGGGVLQLAPDSNEL